MKDHPGGWMRMASRWGVGLVAAAIAALVAPSVAVAAPFVSVRATLVRLNPKFAIVAGQIAWDAEAAKRSPSPMTVGDLRLVAVSDRGHSPTVLATERYERIASHPTQDVVLRVARRDLPTITPGNRVVLTASQHPMESGALTDLTYVTVGQLQPFGSKQDRIGRRDCSSLPIEPGAELDKCDLVGAYLNGALVSERKPATRMRLADLTGATMVGADLTGLSVAGGRLNGADATDAVMNNLSLAGAEGTGLIARGARSGGMDTAGASMIDAQLPHADFSQAVLSGVLLEHARLDDANFRGATWSGVRANTASFRGADLEDLKGTGSDVDFADFTGANMQGAAFSPKPDLEWAFLCHTTMPNPDSFPLGAGDRDCRVPIDQGPPPAPDPYVVVAGKLTLADKRADITAQITWNDKGIKDFGMSVGDIRVVAIDGSTGLPTLIASVTDDDLKPNTPTKCDPCTITDPAKLAALHRGDRVVLTATQHPPLPDNPFERTPRSYVTVRTLRPGPGPEHGRVGSLDCSDMALNATPPTPAGYDFCDLPGAVLTQAALSGSMREADLTGADLDGAGLAGMHFDGAAMGGATAIRARFNNVDMTAAFAPRLTISDTTLDGALFESTQLDEANFERAKLTGETTNFAAASLRGARFTDATFESVDLAFTRLQNAKLDRIRRNPARPDRRISLFLANLTDATLKDTDWGKDEEGDPPWFWATLCHTIMPAGVNVSGDRDCPR